VKLVEGEKSYQQRQKHNCDLLNIHNLKFTNMTHAEQRA
jgi:hypothetical protein